MKGKMNKHRFGVSDVNSMISKAWNSKCFLYKQDNHEDFGNDVEA